MASQIVEAPLLIEFAFDSDLFDFPGSCGLQRSTLQIPGLPSCSTGHLRVHSSSFLVCKSVVAWVCLRVCEREGGWRWDGEGQVARFYELGSQSEGARYFRFSFKRWYFSQVGCVSQLRVSHLTPCIRFDTRLTRFEPNASQMAGARLLI